MLISDLKRIAYTDPSDRPQMLALMKFFEIHATNICVSNSSMEYVLVKPPYLCKKLMWFSPDNINRRFEFTVEIINKDFMDAHLWGARKRKGRKLPVPKITLRLDPVEAVKSGIAKDLFIALYGEDEEDIRVSTPRNNQRLLRRHKKDVDQYLLIDRKKLAEAVKVINGEQFMVKIPSEWMDKLQKMTRNVKFKMIGGKR